MIDTLANMVSTKDTEISLSEDEIRSAVDIHGEFLVLKLSYEDFEDELKNENIKYKISQALSVIVSYEDEGESFESIEKFVYYISSIVDFKQNATFGIKKVSSLSEFPITILFSGILPINQLSMSIGQTLFDLIHSDEDYFTKRFLEFRDILSQEIGIPILPLFPYLDASLEPTEVILKDLLDERLISKFITHEYPDKDTVESYLLKLFYIYKVLANQKMCKFSH